MNIEAPTFLIEHTIAHDVFMPPKSSIFQTPTILFRHNEQAYIPDAFSIGPLHHDRPSLKATEKIKARYLRGLISRSPSPETGLREFVKSIKSMERETRECYAGGAIDYSPDEFVKILVIDGCFIIELFRKNAYTDLVEVDDPIFTMSCMLQFLYHDLILLENQVPWMVLERLFGMTTDPTRNKPLIQLAIEFFANIFSSTPPPMVYPIQDIKHIVDLLRKWLISSIGEEESELGWQPMPSATRLVEAGIKFRRGMSKSILDVNFIDGVLDIPPILIQETTETVFRNLITFEQCYPNCEDRFTSYAILLGNLINTAKDMDILCQNEIIDNWLNPEDAAKSFNKLYHNTYVKKYHYLRLCQQVNRYCQRRWPRWRAVLVRNYFNTPWAILSAMVAAMLLILLFLQTLYTIKK